LVSASCSEGEDGGAQRKGGQRRCKVRGTVLGPGRGGARAGGPDAVAADRDGPRVGHAGHAAARGVLAPDAGLDQREHADHAGEVVTHGRGAGGGPGGGITGHAAAAGLRAVRRGHGVVGAVLHLDAVQVVDSEVVLVVVVLLPLRLVPADVELGDAGREADGRGGGGLGGQPDDVVLHGDARGQARAGEDGGLVVVRVAPVLRRTTLGGAGDPVDGAAGLVDDLPLGLRSAGHADRGEVAGEPVLHEVHSGSVHLEAVVSVRDGSRVVGPLIKVDRTVRDGGLGDAERLPAELARGHRGTRVHLGLGHAGRGLDRAVRLTRGQASGLTTGRGRLDAEAGVLVGQLRGPAETAGLDGHAGRGFIELVRVEGAVVGRGNADEVAVGVGPEGLGLVLAEALGLQLAEQVGVPVGVAADGH